MQSYGTAETIYSEFDTLREENKQAIFSNLNVNDNIRICLDFTVDKFGVILFSLFEALFGIFAFFVLANRPLFAATKQRKFAQKHLSTKLEIKSKQILNLVSFSRYKSNTSEKRCQQHNFAVQKLAGVHIVS